MCAHAVGCAPSLAWLGKPLKCCNFGVCSLIKLKFLMKGPYNFLEWDLRLLHVCGRRGICALPDLAGQTFKVL